ncbi:DNA-binding domain-containing protein [Ancylomarina longa]|uniref:DUF4469 domain-containing protein n=1 Tax=Ancylomarina longa TaxID=2487017 RepID=A0A434AZ42_9BACT|nr:DNA-binding domain-containing protein [Ancylomarina longa]RUT79806.1 DUF4469 domain-containing protein [Ancylomarina longa]
MITYYLKENPFKKGEDEFYGIPFTMGKMDRKELIKECAKEGSGITVPEAESMLSRLETVIGESLQKGFTINTPLFNIQPSIKGVFTGWHDVFDPQKHQIQFSISAGVLLKNYAQESKLHKIPPQKSVVNIINIKNHSENSTAQNIKKGSILEVNGQKLKYDITDSAQGIFLVGDDGIETKIRIVIKNTGGCQIFQIPLSLKVGNYILQIKTLPARYKTIKLGVYDETLRITD